MIFKNDNLGLLIGIFIGSAIGTAGTLLTLKKLKKLDANEEIEKNQAKIDEIYKFYNDKIREIKDEYAETRKNQMMMLSEEEEDVIKVVNTSAATHTTGSPKDIYTDRISNEDSNDDAADFNEGTNTLLSDRGVRINREASSKNAAIDYSKITKKYDNLEKEYEREEIETITFPHQITKDDYENAGGYVKEELIYYEQNGIFADMNDIEMDEYDENYFGLDNLSKFGSEQASLDGANDLFELYLRDNTLRVDFHLIYNGTEDFNKIGK